MVVSGGYLISKIEDPSIEDILALDKANLWKIDRGATNNRSESTRQLTDVLLYSAISLPLWVCATKQAKGDVAESLVMMTETMLLSSGTTFLAKGLSWMLLRNYRVVQDFLSFQVMFLRQPHCLS